MARRTGYIVTWTRIIRQGCSIKITGPGRHTVSAQTPTEAVAEALKELHRRHGKSILVIEPSARRVTR